MVSLWTPAWSTAEPPRGTGCAPIWTCQSYCATGPTGPTGSADDGKPKPWSCSVPVPEVTSQVYSNGNCVRHEVVLRYR
jgi:hypothetical protein